MGNRLSKRHCVDLRHLPAEVFQQLTSEDFTVIRTSGLQQTGWRIPKEDGHECPVSESFWEGPHACNRVMTNGNVGPLGDKPCPWRVHMVFDGDGSDDDAKKHCCGWRPSSPDRRTFWPTRLTDQEAKEAWYIWLEQHLNSLKTPEDLEVAESVKLAEETMTAAELEAKRLTDLEAAYQADEPKRHAAAKALMENPVATPEMMAEMRTRESTGARFMRNAVIPMPGDVNFTFKIRDLEAVSVHNANRVRRLMDSGCPKPIVYWLTSYLTHADFINQYITEEEAKLHLEPLMKPLANYR